MFKSFRSFKTVSMHSQAALLPSLLVLSMAWLPACDSKSTPPAAAPTAKPTVPTTPPPAAAAPAKPSIPSGLISRGALPTAAGLGEVIQKAKVGEKVVFAARVAGRSDPFVVGNAMMVVSDPKLKPCNEREDDQCATPADLCCETRETLRMNTATVQVIGADGKPLPIALTGIEGLTALDHVVIEGVLVERGDQGGFVVTATRIVRRDS